jgi:hypothetical protein
VPSATCSPKDSSYRPHWVPAGGVVLLFLGDLPPPVQPVADQRRVPRCTGFYYFSAAEARLGGPRKGQSSCAAAVCWRLA